MALFLSFLIFGLSMLSLSCSIIIFATSNKQKNDLSFALMAISGTIWGFGFGFLLIQDTAVAALRCRAFGMIGTVACLIFGIRFFISLANSPKWLEKMITIYSYVGVILYPFLVMPERQTFYKSYFGMSYTFSKDIWNTLYNTYVVFFMVFCILTLVIMRKGAKYKRTKVLNNCLWLFIAIMAFGTLLDTILPMMGIAAFPGSTLGQFIAIYIGFFTLLYQRKNSLTLQTVSNHIYHSIDTPIIVINNAIGVEFISNAGYKFFNIQNKNLKFINIVDLFILNENIHNILENKTNIECVVKTNNAYCNVSIEKVRDIFEDVIGYILIITDLTEKNNYITELKKANEIAEKARVEAEIASKSKDNFLANMSHELRTPLNAIIGMNQLIQNDEDKTKVIEYSKQIEKSSKNLLSMIDELFDFSMIQTGKLDIVENPYSINKLLKSIINSYKTDIDNKKLIYNINIDNNVPSLLIGDEKRIRQCIVNLLKNSIKYTEVGKISINVKANIRDNICDLTIEVIDSGIGISEEEIKNLFISFKNLEGTNNREYEGLGVGLNIVRKLMILMNGKFDISSEINKGTKCVLNFSQLIVDSSCEEYHESNSISNICIVGDNSLELSFLKKILLKERIDVDFISNEQFNLIKNKKYDFVIVDYIKEKNNLYENELNNIIYLVEEGINLVNKTQLVKPVKTSQLFELIKKNETNIDSISYENIRMLAVDDNKLNLVVLRGFLKKTGAIVETCNSGAEAIGLTQNNKYDIIFLDHMMPGMDGVETLKRIKSQNTLNSSIPIIVVTANAVEGAREYYLEQGFIDYISKPVDSKVLNSYLYKYLKQNDINNGNNN